MGKMGLISIRSAFDADSQQITYKIFGTFSVVMVTEKIIQMTINEKAKINLDHSTAESIKRTKLVSSSTILLHKLQKNHLRNINLKETSFYKRFQKCLILNLNFWHKIV